MSISVDATKNLTKTKILSWLGKLNSLGREGKYLTVIKGISRKDAAGII